MNDTIRHGFPDTNSGKTCSAFRRSVCWSCSSTMYAKMYWNSSTHWISSMIQFSRDTLLQFSWYSKAVDNSLKLVATPSVSQSLDLATTWPAWMPDLIQSMIICETALLRRVHATRASHAIVTILTSFLTSSRLHSNLYSSSDTLETFPQLLESYFSCFNLARRRERLLKIDKVRSHSPLRNFSMTSSPLTLPIASSTADSSWLSIPQRNSGKTAREWDSISGLYANCHVTRAAERTELLLSVHAYKHARA